MDLTNKDPSSPTFIGDTLLTLLDISKKLNETEQLLIQYWCSVLDPKLSSELRTESLVGFQLTGKELDTMIKEWFRSNWKFLNYNAPISEMVRVVDDQCVAARRLTQLFSTQLL